MAVEAANGNPNLHASNENEASPDENLDVLDIGDAREGTIDDIELKWYEKIYVWFQSIDYNDPRKVQCAILLESVSVTVWMTILTLWALYAEDFKIALTDNDADTAFSAIAFVAFVFFFLEWSLASWSVPKYLFSFFFWLDLVATLSLVTDILFIAEPLGISVSSGVADPSSARAGRAARAGTRAGRIVRVIRLVRIGKLSKQFFSWWKGDDEDDVNAGGDETKEFEDEQKPSNLGNHLSQLITKRVIIGVLTILFVIPFIQGSQSENLYPIDAIVEQLEAVYNLHAETGDITATQFETYRQWWIDDYRHEIANKKLLYLEIAEDEILNKKSVLDKLRITELERFATTSGTIVAVFGMEAIVIDDAWKSIGLTTFLIFMLTSMALIFQSDTSKYVVGPINRMVDSVRVLTENPMMQSAMDPNQQNKEEAQFETSMLHGTINRIGRLLQLGFGQAGAEIIKSSLSSNLAANVGGRHVNAIFGFCDIRNFTDATECLQQQVMNYVNEIASVVHGIVVEHSGAPNKNVGDAFLLVWSLPDDARLSDFPLSEDQLPPRGVQKKVQYLGDLSLMSLIKIIIAINDKNKNDFLKYRQNINIIRRMGPDWEVKLGWGLHVGWAIEGAIGSRYKIDASYLSPNVNLAEDLEGATKFYNVPFLVSEQMAAILSPFANKNILRKIDRVKITGIEKPFDLYCVDIWQYHTDKLQSRNVSLSGPYIDVFEMPTDLSNMSKIEKKYFMDDELCRIHQGFPVRHRQVWGKAFNAYIAGDWKIAETLMRETLEILPTDGPCESLLNYMSEYDFDSTKAEWTGFRHHD